MRSLLLATIFTAILAIPVSAQISRQDSIWQPMRVFLGSWKGKGGGEPGRGEYERTYQFILNKRFIEVRNKSTYAPTEKNPKGEVHEDVGYISYDKARRFFILRQFHIEGFVNQYKLESISPDGGTMVFVSEAIENIPAGWRARETFEIVDDNQIQETFELAEPGKELTVYSRVTLHRE